MNDAPKAQIGTWKLTAPNGQEWTAESPIKVASKEAHDRIPAEVRHRRLVDSINELADNCPECNAPVLYIPGLTPKQLEMLALLSEEMGEAQQAIGKIIRHGYDSYHPEYPEKDNKEDLEKELGHVRLAVQLLSEAGDISLETVRTHSHAKRLSIGKYLHNFMPLER